MRSYVLTMAVFCLTHCVQNKVNNPGALLYQSFDTIAKHQINPLLLNLQAAEVDKLLDSLEPATREASYPIRIYWWLAKSQAKIISNDYDSARHFIENALTQSIAKDSNGLEALSAKVKLAGLLTFQSKWDSALQFAHEAYFLARKRDTFLPDLTYRLFEIYTTIGDNDGARRYAFEGYNNTRQLPGFQAIFANAIASYYESVGLVDSAIDFFNTLSKEANLSNPEFKAVRDQNLGLLLVRKQKVREGLQHLLSAKPTLQQLHKFDAQAAYNIAHAYLSLNEFDNCLRYVDTAFSLIDQNSMVGLRSQLFSLKANALLVAGRANTAFHFMDLAYRHAREERDSTIAKTARELEAKYSLREKEDKINKLAIAAQMQESINNQRKTVIIGLVIITTLASGLAVMLWKRHQMKTIIDQVQLEQRLLRTQMEPHFIFNTLSVLQSIIRIGNIDKALLFLNQFSKLLRVSLESARKGLVHLHDEIRALDSYLLLQKMHYEHYFDYEINVYSGYEDDNIYIPPMLLQPFVENAVLHGIARLGEQGRIKVDIKKRGLVLICEIDDNGRGLETDSENSQKRSISTMLTEERIALLSRQTGNEASIKIRNKTMDTGQPGVHVIMHIPYSKKMNT